MVEMFYTISIAFPVLLAALGAGIGQGLIGIKSLQAMNIQPHASIEINRISLIGMTLTETSAILGLVLSILLLLDTSIPLSYEYAAFGKIGIGFAIGITGLVAGIASSLPAQAACLATARQPFFSNKILQLMLLTQTVIMTPNIFGFLIALLINFKTATVVDINGALQLLAAGIVIGIGSIGPCIGLSLFAHAACTAIGINRKSYPKILPFTFVCEAIIETPAIFSLLIALLILNVTVTPETHQMMGIAFIASALCMGFSTVGTGISAGKIGSTACAHIGANPETYAIISKIGLLALAMIDTFAIYGFIISIILIYAI
jgi:F0F1-type ATP synthase membrane subunit c/vacuolar-type H+-ATPase subunit K